MRKRLLAILSGLLLAVASVVMLAVPAHASTYVQGRILCVSGAPFVGAWVKASNGGSGWADWHHPAGDQKFGDWSYSLPNDGSYQLHIGCGGTPQNWATSSYTSFVSGSHDFTCYDLYYQPYCDTTG